MLIEIKTRFTGKILISGEYTSTKECLEKNRDADLRGVNLRDADLRDANLRDANLRGANLRGANLRGANLGDANLGDANLGDANLRGANLRDADLGDADLRGANLRDAKNYVNSHSIFKEAIRHQVVSVFSQAEWEAIGQITIHTLCWDAIKKRFANVMGNIFDILAKGGFTEWAEYWKSIQ